jgi:hypothetical protein
MGRVFAGTLLTAIPRLLPDNLETTLRSLSLADAENSDPDESAM